MQISSRAVNEFLNAEPWTLWAERGVRVIVILGGAWFFSRLTRRYLGQVRTSAMSKVRQRGDPPGTDLRSATVVSVLGRSATVVIWLGALLMALNEFAFHIEPILAGFGVVGLAVGLGTQTLIKDWLGGVLVLIEDQMRIGDSVTINGISGSVEELNLRTTVLRGETGAVYVISNGSITTLANMSREYSYFIFDAMLAHGAKIDRAIEILKEVGQQVANEPQYEAAVLAPLEVMGVDKLAVNGVVIRARIQTLPGQQWGIGRELNQRVNARWETEGIPFPPVG